MLSSDIHHLTNIIRNYDHVAGLWQHEQWLPEAAVELARAHYGAYMVQRVDGLRIITLNTDFCTFLFICSFDVLINANPL